MSPTGPILIVDDDLDDQEIIKLALHQIGVSNRVHAFHYATNAIEFLKKTDEIPFLIICDINMPVINGLEFKAHLEADAGLRKKAVPFIFYSTSAVNATVAKAFHKLNVHGFFEKSSSIEDIKKTFSVIINYWQQSQIPMGR